MEIFIAGADDEGCQMAKMFVKPVVDFLLVYSKHHTAVHFDQICLQIFNIILVLSTRQQLIHGGKGHIKNVDDLINKGVSEILNGQNEVAHAADDGKFDISVEAFLYVKHDLLHYLGGLVQKTYAHHSCEVSHTCQGGFECCHFVDFLQSDDHCCFPVLWSPAFKSLLESSGHGSEHVEAFRFDTELVDMVVDESAEFAHELIVGDGIFMCKDRGV